jgi:hypothetical protein
VTYTPVGRSYIAIRRQEGCPDVVTHFPYTASEVEAIRWCESEGYKVIKHEVKPTPEDEKHIATVTVVVEPKF